MKAYILDTQRSISPFANSVSKIYSPLINYGNLQREELALAGLMVRNIKSLEEIDTIEPSILLFDYVFVSTPIIRKFVFLCKNNTEKVQRISVLKSKLTNYYVSLMDIDEIEIKNERCLLFDLFYLPPKIKFEVDTPIDKAIDRLRHISTPVKVSQNFGIRIERLSNVKGKPYFEEFPLTDEIIGHHRFWHHSLLMNILYLYAFRKRLISEEYPSGFLHKKRIINSKNVTESVIGSNVWIHPTSVVENSIVADNVRIGAKTIIKDSVIMRDCSIGDSNLIKYSLFGENVTSLSNSRFRCSVISPGCTVSNLGFCYSMLGEKSFLTTAVIFLYEGVDSTISIKVGKEEFDTGRYFLGSAAGAYSVLGTRAIVSPGLSIPPKTLIVLRPEEGVMKIPDLNESDYYVWDSATLKRFDEIFTDLNKNDFI